MGRGVNYNMDTVIFMLLAWCCLPLANTGLVPYALRLVP